MILDYAVHTDLTSEELEKSIETERQKSDALTDWPDPDNYIDD